MVKPIVKDVLFLMQPSQPADISDKQTAQDLADTLMAHRDHCVGLAANMIGVRKNIIVFLVGNIPFIMLNPRIVSHSAESYEAEEGCLSLSGTRTAIRYQQIEVAYDNRLLQHCKGTYQGFTAQIIQHEIDHCHGILI